MTEASSQPPSERAASPTPSPDWVDAVRRHVASLRYGVVQITVHAGNVVQVERTERFRFESPASPAPNRESP